MFTYLQEKNATANILSRTDGAISNTIRDNAINFSRQNEIANAYPFSWLRKSATVAVSGGVGDLPEDFNIAHSPLYVRDSNEQELQRVGQQSYGYVTYGYFIDWNSTSSRWQLNCQEDGNYTVVYYHVPATLSNDATVDVIPDLKVIAYFAAATYWLSSERDETNADRFSLKAEKRLKDLINIDKRSNPIRLTRSTAYAYNMGWNSGE